MKNFKVLLTPCRIVLSHHILNTNICRLISKPKATFNLFGTRTMAQRSITSFFKVTPPKSKIKEEKIDIEKSSESGGEDTLTANGITETETKSSKRQRINSSESEPSSPDTSIHKKKTKRQRIESSSSESQSPKKQGEIGCTNADIESKLSPKQEVVDPDIKVEKVEQPKTYESPKSKKSKKPLTAKNNQNTSPKTKKSPVKVKEEMSQEENGEVIDNCIDKKENVKVKKEVDEVSEESAGKVPETEYNPAKSKYHPVNDACWAKSEEVPYLALAKTLEAIEATSARLKIIEILSNYMRSVIALTPEDLLPSVYLCLNQLAPAYESLELGIAETYLMKAIGQCTGRTLAQVKSAAQKCGDLGQVAEQARSTQRTMFAVPPLKVRRVFAALKEVAHMSGQASVNKKINKIQSLYVACRHSEARYLIRSLEGKLRIGLAEQSVLAALALAATATPPAPAGPPVLDASRGLAPDQFKARVEHNTLVVKSTYCECPDPGRVVAALLARGVAALPAACPLAPGVPLRPMLAQPTHSVRAVFQRLDEDAFTCEWKYDGERAQIHVPSRDLARAALFSRNQEDNTSKYPDVIRRLPLLLKEEVESCVLDCEAVAYDTNTKQILPFQVLSTRKRKDASEADIKVQVCVFVFDLLFLNGRALVREPLAERRALLHRHFAEAEGAWRFATHRDCAGADEVQAFLEEAVRGGCEGLMVKALRGERAHYHIARRSHGWLKLKKDYLEGAGDSVDAVVIGGYRGRGKRAGLFGGFLLACWEPAAEQYQALCKIGTGFSDEDLAALSADLQRHVIDAPRNYYRFDASVAPDAWFSAACVWEVRCADLSLSPAHRAAQGLVDPDKGISLRFPRFVRARPDKAPEQATTAQQIATMYLAQDQIRNLPAAAARADLDDYY